jgi:hypothetical protein
VVKSLEATAAIASGEFISAIISNADVLDIDSQCVEKKFTDTSTAE